ncbi:MAG: SsrA-binding protein SmpB [Clostridiales bacterium]|nr:SsrA-binding protein SmpB [Clostridiales bacterium]
MSQNIIANNKKAYFEYFIEETFEAGIVLVGAEVKSVRDGGISLLDSFIMLKNQEVFLKNAYIKPFEKASAFAPDSKRDRKLLLNKREIQKLIRGKKEKSLTIVPLKVYFKNNKVKIEIALAKGKKLYDKKDTLKEKSLKKDIAQATKHLKQY